MIPHLIPTKRDSVVYLEESFDENGRIDFERKVVYLEFAGVWALDRELIRMWAVRKLGRTPDWDHVSVAVNRNKLTLAVINYRPIGVLRVG